MASFPPIHAYSNKNFCIDPDGGGFRNLCIELQETTPLFVKHVFCFSFPGGTVPLVSILSLQKRSPLVLYSIIIMKRLKACFRSDMFSDLKLSGCYAIIRKSAGLKNKKTGTYTPAHLFYQ
jgi:hypothetical protein